MKYNLSTFQQQGLVNHLSLRPLKMDFFTWINTSGEVSSSNMSPDKRKNATTQSPPIPLGSESQKKRKIWTNWFCCSWLLRARVHQKWSIFSVLSRLLETPKGVGFSCVRKLLFRHHSWSKKISRPKDQPSWVDSKLWCLEEWGLG